MLVHGEQRAGCVALCAQYVIGGGGDSWRGPFLLSPPPPSVRAELSVQTPPPCVGGTPGSLWASLPMWLRGDHLIPGGNTAQAITCLARRQHSWRPSLVPGRLIFTVPGIPLVRPVSVVHRTLLSETGLGSLWGGGVLCEGRWVL